MASYLSEMKEIERLIEDEAVPPSTKEASFMALFYRAVLSNIRFLEQAYVDRILCSAKDEFTSEAEIAESAFAAGYEEGHKKGYDKGHKKGHKKGYDEGWNKGYDDAG